MDTAGVIALLACMATICTKILFVLRQRSQERILEHEHQTLEKTRTDLYLARQRRKRLTTENKRLAALGSRTRQNLERLTVTLEELQERKREEDEVREHQREVIHGKKKQ